VKSAAPTRRVPAWRISRDGSRPPVRRRTLDGNPSRHESRTGSGRRIFPPFRQTRVRRRRSVRGVAEASRSALRVTPRAPRSNTVARAKRVCASWPRGRAESLSCILATGGVTILAWVPYFTVAPRPRTYFADDAPGSSRWGGGTAGQAARSSRSHLELRRSPWAPRSGVRVSSVGANARVRVGLVDPSWEAGGDE